MAGLTEGRASEARPAPLPPPRFSLVIPAFNEEALLPRLLDSVDRARALYAGGPEPIEVIVADDGPTDATAGIARERGCRTVAAGAHRYWYGER